jgi:hypothetical protein
MGRVIWPLAFLGGTIAASFFLGPLLALTAAPALALAVLGLRRSHALAGGQQLPRPLAAASAALVGGLGVFFVKVLVANPQDNAYPWIALLGMLLLATAVPFALAALGPAGRLRGWLARGGIVLVWCVGAPAALILLLGAPLYLLSTARAPPGAMLDNRVATNHLIGACLLLAVVWLVGYHWPRRSRRVGAG